MNSSAAVLVGQEAVEDAKPGPDDTEHTSVTTVIGVIDKPALVYWAAEQTALAAIEDLDAWQSIARGKGGEAEAVKYLTGARFRTPPGQRTAADLGTAVHGLCEQYALTGTRPEADDECRPFLDQFDRWLQTAQPTYRAAEVALFHTGYLYAGTCDAFLDIDGTRFIADYKTTRKSFDRSGKPTTPYPEQVALQLAAYRHADLAAVWRPRRTSKFRRRTYLLSPAERAQGVPVPEVDMGLCIHITPEHCEAFPIRVDQPVFDAFLYAAECFRWVDHLSKTAMGEPLAFPDREAAA